MTATARQEVAAFGSTSSPLLLRSLVATQDAQAEQPGDDHGPTPHQVGKETRPDCLAEPGMAIWLAPMIR